MMASQPQPEGAAEAREDDPFDRQRCVDGWRQDEIERQTCLVLGAGGLGCSVAMTLARLGVARIIVVDRDVVETSNLNRQVLFSRDDVGRSKAEAAAEGLARHCVGGTEVEWAHMDAVKEWARVVAMARRSTVVFNNIDVGEYFDVAVLALAKGLGIPYAAGSSYATTWIVEYFTGQPRASSFSLAYAEPHEVLARLTPELVQTYDDLCFLPADAVPPTRSVGSNALVCVSAGVMTVNMWAQGLCGAPSMPNYTKFDVRTLGGPEDMVAWPPPEVAGDDEEKE